MKISKCQRHPNSKEAWKVRKEVINADTYVGATNKPQELLD